MTNQKHTRPISSALTLLLVLLSTATPAQDFIANPSEPHGLVVTSVDLEAQNIYSVYAVAVNGQELARRENALWLKPGEHTIKAVNKSTLNRNFVPGLRGDRSRESMQPLTLNVEAGKTYYVGLKADSGRRADWQLVVWKIEDQN